MQKFSKIQRHQMKIRHSILYYKIEYGKIIVEKAGVETVMILRNKEKKLTEVDGEYGNRRKMKNLHNWVLSRN